MINFFYTLMVIVCVFSCRSAHNVKSIDTTLLESNTDTLYKTQSVNAEITEIIAPSNDILRETLNKNLIYQSFYAKIKFDFDDGTQSISGNAFLHLHKDSILWISIKGPLNVELSKMLITNDSIKILNKIEKTAQVNSIISLNNTLGIPLDFTFIQNIITGQPFVFDSIFNYTGYKNDSCFLNANYKGLLSKIAIDTSQKRVLKYTFFNDKSDDPVRLEINYTNFIQDSVSDFPMERNVIINANQRISIHLDFKETQWNKSFNYLFKIPENYTLKE